MATAPVLDTSASNNIAVIVAQNPALVLIDGGKRDDLYAHIRAEVEAFTPDLTTEKGRAAIKSLAFKITRTKTAIDAAGKQLNEEARAKIGVVDAARRDARDTLDKMAEDVRRPLTEWEDAEKARVAECRRIIAEDIKMAAHVALHDTAASVRQRGMDVWNIVLDADAFGDLLPEAQAAKDEIVATLKRALDRLTQEEADRAELARLRAQAEARAEADRIEAERLEAERAEAGRLENERRAAEQAERDRAAAAEREAARIEQARADAAAAAQREAERVARQQQEATERAHAEALAAERRRADEAERARQAEADRINAERERAEAECRREEAEQAKREADKKHRTSVKRAAKEAMMTCGASEDVAQKIVIAIIAGEVPAVTLRF